MVNATKNFDDVVIIIPVYKDVIVRDVINAIPAEFSKIICVDDGSPGHEVSEAILSTRAKLVRHPMNLGQGAALQTGIEFALLDKSVQYFVTFDADGQHQIEDVYTMLEEIRGSDGGAGSNVDIVLGSRFLGEAKNISWSKQAMLKFAIVFSNITSQTRLTDTHNGLRVFNRQVAENLNIQMSDFSHASEILHKIVAHKWQYKEVPVTILYSEYSKHKGQSIINAVNIAFDVLLNKLTGGF
jgi:glycosyltransferase involved in cell wall biosynthesis